MDHQEQKVLHERARLLAQARDKSPRHDEKLIVVAFFLLPEKYAIEASFVQHVFTLTDLTPVPGTPPYIMGVVNHRGTILSVVNLKVLFGLKESGLTEMNKVLIISNGSMEFGIVADSISGSGEILKKDITAPPTTLNKSGASYIRGILGDGTVLLNAAGILESESMLIKQ